MTSGGSISIQGSVARSLSQAASGKIVVTGGGGAKIVSSGGQITITGMAGPLIAAAGRAEINLSLEGVAQAAELLASARPWLDAGGSEIRDAADELPEESGGTVPKSSLSPKDWKRLKVMVVGILAACGWLESLEHIAITDELLKVINIIWLAWVLAGTIPPLNPPD